MGTHFVTHASTITGAALRYATLDGRTYLIAPVVALVAGVVNGLLVEADELRKFAEAWNGRPLPIRHPQAGDAYISANAPDVIERQVVGHFFNAHIAEGDRLAGELWVDVAKCQALGGDALAVLHRLQAGGPVEVSTAYYCDIEVRAGTHQGDAYEGIQRNLRPDHLALLPDEVGACSWQDGCGAPRVNTNQQPCGCPCAHKEEQMDVQDETTDVEEASAQPAQEGSVAIPEDVAELARLVSELGGVEKLAAALRGLTANAESRKAELVVVLTANAACAFTASDLGQMTLEQLEKLQRSLSPSSYAGRPAVNALKEGEYLIGNELYRPYRSVTPQGGN